MTRSVAFVLVATPSGMCKSVALADRYVDQSHLQVQEMLALEEERRGVQENLQRTRQQSATLMEVHESSS